MLRSVKCSGFTLVELLITIAISAILLTAAVPGFRQLLVDQRISTVTNDLYSAFNLARSEAVKRGQTVLLSNYVGNGWEGGWTVWIDNDGNGQRSDGEILRYWQVSGGEVTIAADRNLYSFSGDGLVDSAGSVQFCSTEVPDRGRLLVIAATGRVTNQRQPC